jgi:hypothetical protein
MIQNVLGKLRNIQVPKSKPLLPVFEAITNSIDAIRELSQEDGTIIITALRDTILSEDGGSKKSGPIHSFTIFDNGTGFTEENYQSFNEADSTHKQVIGGKGLGRFSWLKVYDHVEINSVFNENATRKERNFHFVSKVDGIENIILNESSKKIGTFVHLVNMNKAYRTNYMPVTLQVIAEKILEHLLPIFLSKNAPQIIITDEIENININDLYNVAIGSQISEDTLSIKGHDFSIIDMRSSKGFSQHEVHYCADRREVKKTTVKTYIPELQFPIADTDGNETYIQVYIYSDFLNEHVNAERTGFVFDDTGVSLAEFLTLEEINKSIFSHIATKFSSLIDTIKEANKEFVKDYINQQSPQQKHLLKYADDKLSRIHKNMQSKEIDIELFKIEQELELQLKKEGENIVTNQFGEIPDVDYQTYFDNFVEKTDAVNRSKLANYIIHRKSVLNLFEKLLELDDDAKYSREDRLHKLIVPMHKTGNEIDYYAHNLWLIDEKLAYHFFQASDKSMQEIFDDIDNNRRSDIITFNTPNMFVDAKHDFDSIVIVELKKPMRNNYKIDDFDRDKNPYDQVIGYILDIKDGKIKTLQGRPINIKSDTPFFAYIIADMTDKMHQLARRENFKKTVDGKGYYYFHEALNAHIEIIPYDKVLVDAQKRNRTLFDQLGI